MANAPPGAFALTSNTTGGGNTATGYQALFSNSIGGGNTAVGDFALGNNMAGSDNIALGQFAGSELTSGSGNIDIGNFGLANESNTIRIGDVETQTRAFIAGISAVPVTGIGVVVASDGQLGVAPSSRRFKEQIKPMDKASEAILALKPVTFRYEYEIDRKQIPQFGLVAEEVAKVNPDLVACDAKGEVYTVRYDAVNAMLLNEFLKAHTELQQQQATIEKQQKQIQALTTGLQKVSDQLEVKMPSLRTVDNH